MKHELSTRMTRELLAGSLKKLMQKKPLSKITITEIVKDCGVNRHTFYYHFDDIYALVEWMFDQEAVELLRKSDNCLSWDEGVLLFLEYIKDNEHICRCALDSLGREHLQRFFYNDVVRISGKIVGELSDGLDVDERTKRFITEFYTSAIVETAIRWIRQGMRETPREIIRLLDITMRGNIKAALERAAV